MDERTEAAGHTPGPWEIDDTRDDTWIILEGKENNSLGAGEICELSYAGWNAEANARLIAAAPEYDSAARLAVDGAERIYPGRYVITKEGYDALVAAIAKAEGGEG